MLRSVRLTISLLTLGSSLLTLGSGALPSLNAANPTDADLERRFSQTVRPFVTLYCVVCHSGPTPAGGFDLQRYTSMESVADDFAHWTLALRKLSAKEMPPQPMKQPPENLRRQVIEWITAARKNEARKRAGDPGLVQARRLSNAEYNYTVRDLTGVDLRPAREFPVDPANQAGFDNSGESLTVSPSLMSKYLDAARRIADHLVLQPDGFSFAPYPMLVETDRDQYCIQQIVDFYDRQNTNFADYFRAAWIYRHREVLGTRRATLADVAAQTGVSAKYLTTIWRALETREDVGPMAKLQAMWHTLPVPKAGQPDLARDETNRMSAFVVRMRQDTSLTFASPRVKGLS